MTERARRSAGRGRAAGFTVVEMVVALALAVALAAVVLPASMSWLPAAGLDETAGRVEAAIALARADAQRRGVVVEVVTVREGGGGMGLRSRDVALEVEKDAEPVGRGAAADVGTELTPLLELPMGVTLTRETPGDAEELGATRAGSGGDDARGAAANQDLVLALALPDGRVVAGGQSGELRAVGADGRWVVLSINGWTGAVTGRPGVPEREDAEDQPREDVAEAP